MRGYNTFANRGRDFEDFVIQVNDLYTRSGKAVVYKVPTEFLPIRDSTGQIKSCKVEHKSCVDFLGRYNGTPVAVEAKQTHTGRIDFDAVQPHQAAFLDAAAHGKRGPGRFSSGLGSSPRRPHRPAVPGNH